MLAIRSPGEVSTGGGEQVHSGEGQAAGEEGAEGRDAIEGPMGHQEAAQQGGDQASDQYQGAGRNGGGGGGQLEQPRKSTEQLGFEIFRTGERQQLGHSCHH